MYKAIKTGKFQGRSGTVYRFTQGQTIDAPNGDLYYCPGVEWIGKGKHKKPKALPTVETVIPE